ncbi:MAG: DUF4097 domain-containing protein [Bacteroidales bacterium]|nr:DUF4097 domain-containing protein [Bacteroidales bacterium]
MKAIKAVIMTAMVFATTMGYGQLQQIKQMITVAENSKESSAKEVVLDAQFCKVSISQAEGTSTTVSGKLEALEANDAYKVVINEEGTKISAGIVVPEEAKSSYAGEFQIAVPEGVKINIVSGSGNITINDMKGCDFAITTVKGKVTCKNTNCSMNIETKGGAVTFTKVEGKYDIVTASGKVNITDAKGTIKFDTSDGDATVTNFEGDLSGKTITGTQTYKSLNGDIQIFGGTGAIKISDSEGLFKGSLKSATLNLFKVKGEFHIESEKGSIIGAQSANGVTLTASSDFTTTEGKINMTLLNKKEDLSFDLEHSHKGDIGLIAKGERTSKKTLKCGKGSIIVTGRTVTGAQTFK